MPHDDDPRDEQEEIKPSRREFLKGGAVAAGAGLAATGLGGANNSPVPRSPTDA